MSTLIESHNLRREFGTIIAVDDVSFSAHRGDVLGFLGPNGAGKTTTMRMLTGFLTPSAGTALVGGFSIEEKSIEVRRLIGYLPENAPLYADMRVRNFLEFIAEVRELKGSLKRDAIDRVVEATSLVEVLNQQIDTLSKGFKRRVGLAQALIHDPQVLIMDEPTDGLDPNQKHEVRALIHRMAKDKCIVISTHILEEVEEVCNRVIIISSGRVVADSTPAELRRKSRRHGAIVMTFEGGAPSDAIASLRKIKEVQEVTDFASDGSTAVITAFPSDSPAALAAILRQAESAGWRFADLRVESGKLDEVFREITALGKSGER